MHFGPFALDERTWLLARDGTAVELSPRLVEILAYLAARPGTIVSKDELLERFWPDVHVTENTLTRAIADIRKALGDHAAEPQFVQTVSRRGYRFIGGRAADADDVFASWVKGRADLDSLSIARLPTAVAAFERAVAELPWYAPAHAGLANAYLLQLDEARAGLAPDVEGIARAMAVARQACLLDASLGEGWAVLGHLLTLAGQSRDAQAAARRATAVEPGNWRHQYRLALATWGEDRLRAVDRALALMPGFAPGHLLSAMVFVARGALDRAEHEATLGAEAQRRQAREPSPLPAAGLHWLRGLVLWARGDVSAALGSLAEELATKGSDHVYARECVVNAQLAHGYIRLTQGADAEAASSFRAVLDALPRHPRAALGLAVALERLGASSEARALRAPLEEAISRLTREGRLDDAALLTAGDQALGSRPAEALRTLEQLLRSAPPGRTGWHVPIDPAFAHLRRLDGFAELLSILAARAA
ncbi:MAG: winged helix-turn-helix domain-containing protein [Vicinamibacterales bacterium]